MKSAGLRLFHRCGLLLGCILALSGPSMAQITAAETSGDAPAAALVDPAISADELARISGRRGSSDKPEHLDLAEAQ